MNRQYDVAIIGAGITGAAIARQLAQWDVSVALIDAQSDVAMGTSRANSAIVHAGYDCPPGSVEARMNVRGNMLMNKWCRDLDVPLQWCGSMVIGFTDEDRLKIETLYRHGIENGVPDMRIVDGDEARRLEPALNEDVICALWAKTGGITCPYQLTIACAENARDNGCAWLLNTPVTGIEHKSDTFIIHTQTGDIHARFIVNAAGVFADDIARMIGDDSFSIHPRKGEYLLLDRTATTVKRILFQTPSVLGKGVLVSPTVDGNSFAGPTAVNMEDKQDKRVTKEGIEQLSNLALKSVPDLNLRAVITSFAGVRAQPSTGDFIIEPSESNPKFIHAAGICSPGLTSAPAIAEAIETLLTQAGLLLTPRAKYVARHHAIPAFREMDFEARQQAIAKDANYGRIICRCESVTEAEIIQAIERGARDVDAVKRRTRAGMGRCQGGFCGPRVMEILARELDITMDQVTKSGGQSWMVLPREGSESNEL